MCTKVMKVLAEVIEWLELVILPVVMVFFGWFAYDACTNGGTMWAIVFCVIMVLAIGRGLISEAIERAHKRHTCALAKNVFLGGWTLGFACVVCLHEYSYGLMLPGEATAMRLVVVLFVVVALAAIVLLAIAHAIRSVLCWWQKRIEKKAGTWKASRSDC